MKGIYLTGGYPDRRTFIRCAEIVEEEGFDFIEIGLPFNDPLADGPVISEAIHSTISKHITTDNIIDDIIGMDHMEIPKYIMTYSNIPYSYGLEKFSNRLRNHLDGIIIADLPNRAAQFFYDSGFDIPIVPFATPDTREQDMNLINSSKSSFVYLVGIRGVTGQSSNNNSADIERIVSMLKKNTNKKIVMGFGIKNAKDCSMALDMCDGFVVGTEAVKRQPDAVELRKYLKSINIIDRPNTAANF